METHSGPGQTDFRFAFIAFCMCLGFHFYGALVGLGNESLPGVEFRQAQTGLSTYWIKEDGNFSLAYPTPVLGKPWSIPMEFPLYQWTVVLVDRTTGMGLTASARLVSLACYYLTLPAIFLLLGGWNITPSRRWMVLAVIVTCPFYIFYSRAFLIETMALMFALWFWVSFRAAVLRSSLWWLLLTVMVGAGAGLVKATTFGLYLLPVTGWALFRLWRNRSQGQSWRELASMFIAIGIPLAFTFGWIRLADVTKESNPLAGFLLSSNLSDFNWGTWGSRFSLELWQTKLRIVATQVSWWPLFVVAAVAALHGRRRWWEIALCLSIFFSAMIIFPTLYAYHDYYYVANALLLLLAMGLAIVGLSETGTHPLWVWLCFAVVCGGQATRYFQHYFGEQRALRAGGNALSYTLREMTHPRDVMIVQGQDWNSMLPYYSERRALMIREEMEHNISHIEAAFDELAGERVGALVVTRKYWEQADLIRRASRLGLETKPSFFSADSAVFLPETRRRENIRRLHVGNLPDLELASGMEVTKETLAGRWMTLSQLTPMERNIFDGMQPLPVRFYSSFGPNLDRSSGQLRFGVHPVTRLVFALERGRYVLATSVKFSPAAYDSTVPAHSSTDGVEVSLHRLGESSVVPPLFSRLLMPRDNPADQGDQPIITEFTMSSKGEVELFFGPGPQNMDTRDWVSIGPVLIRDLD